MNELTNIYENILKKAEEFCFQRPIDSWNFSYSNRSITEFLGFDLAPGKTLYDIIHIDDLEIFHNLLFQVQSDGSKDFHISYRIKNSNENSYFWVTERTSIVNRDGKYYLEGVLIDGRKESELTSKAYKDELTGSYTRSYLNDKQDFIVSALESQELKVGVLIFDLDHFKKVNDTHGHGVGDIVLKEFVEVLNLCSRSNDEIIRIGGEEFLLIGGLKTTSELAVMAERIREAVENHPFSVVGSLTCSIGCAVHSRRSILQETISIADERLYSSKNSGRNRITSK